jgi:hypothetical protein
VAPVNITGTLSPSPAAPSAEVRVSLSVGVNCSNYSLPDCGPAAPSLSFAWLVRGSPLSSAIAFGQYVASPSGSLAVTVLAPTMAGSYLLEVASVTAGYNGNDSLGLSVAAPTSGAPTGSSGNAFSVDDAIVVGAVLSLAAVAVVTVVVLRKRRLERAVKPRRGRT